MFPCRVTLRPLSHRCFQLSSLIKPLLVLWRGNYVRLCTNKNNVGVICRVLQGATSVKGGKDLSITQRLKRRNQDKHLCCCGCRAWASWALRAACPPLPHVSPGGAEPCGNNAVEKCWVLMNSESVDRVVATANPIPLAKPWTLHVHRCEWEAESKRRLGADRLRFTVTGCSAPSQFCWQHVSV